MVELLPGGFPGEDTGRHAVLDFFALCRIGAPLGRKEAIFLVVPPIAFIAAASIGKIDVGLRHILPMYPFLFVLASRIATAPFRRAWVAPVLCGLPLMLSTVSSLGIAPHDLAYFNELAGGPGNEPLSERFQYRLGPGP